MDPQYPDPVAPPPPPSPTIQSTQDKLKKTRANFLIVSVLAVILLLTVGLLSFRAFVNTGKLNRTYNDGVAAGKKDQANADAAKIKDISENPYRTYTAAKELGAFQVSFPRNWSLWQSSNESDPLQAIANPEVVDDLAKLYALRFTMHNGNFSEIKTKYEGLIKSTKNKVSESSVKISGIDSFKFTGLLSTTTPNATITLVPVRDKVLEIQTDDNSKYTQAYNEILNKIKINP